MKELMHPSLFVPNHDCHAKGDPRRVSSHAGRTPRELVIHKWHLLRKIDEAKYSRRILAYDFEKIKDHIDSIDV